ncbi:complement component C7-like [Drosophila ficusphila]|uniref:complement component C7-like n=1 Tax=Drosophila ficusphila TaxID=30025 RepID=UPI001C895C82|nr:complement component C7-like [Drosophila ficusphila]
MSLCSLFFSCFSNGNAACLYDKWQCDDGTCIAKELLCNGNIDCPEDISDERYCEGE